MIARIADRTTLRILTIMDEDTRGCLALFVARRITSQDVIDQLFRLEVFTVLAEARVLIERWRREYNEFWPPIRFIGGIECPTLMKPLK